MKFTLDRHSLETFNKGRLLEVEGFYSAEKIRQINQEIDRLLVENKLDRCEDMMRYAHDLFRTSETLKRALNLPKLAEVIYELISVKPLRLVSEQLLECAKTTFDQQRDSSFFIDAVSLNDSSSVTDLVLGVVIALKTQELAEGEEPHTPFSSVVGNVTFFGPEHPLPAKFLREKMNERYLVLAFSSSHAQYVYQEADPQNHYLKRLGYVYGDKLKDSLHPIIFR